MIFYKWHQRQFQNRTRAIIAMCDENLIGKKLSGKNCFLDLDTYRSFYIGEKVSLQQAHDLVKEYFLRGQHSEGVSFNLVGKEALAAVKQWVDVSKAKKIAGVPHLQVYKV